MVKVITMENRYKLLLIYFIAISLISVIVCVADKARAKKGKWRIKESRLFLLSALGGGAAMYITMRLIRHKTLHKQFMIGIPLIIIAQTVLLIIAVRFGIL